MTAGDARDLHGAHEDERSRVGRERRAVQRAIADERVLAANRLDALLPYSAAPADMVEDVDFRGCYE